VANAEAADGRSPETQAAPESIANMRRLQPPAGYASPRRRRFAEQTVASFSAMTGGAADVSGGPQNHDRLRRSGAARNEAGSGDQSASRLAAAPASAPSLPQAPRDLDIEAKLAGEIASWQLARSKSVDVG